MEIADFTLGAIINIAELTHDPSRAGANSLDSHLVLQNAKLAQATSSGPSAPSWWSHPIILFKISLARYQRPEICARPNF